MLKNQFPIHFFHAHGCAFGAEFTKPFRAVIESQAATAVTSIGGHAHTSMGPFNYKEVVRIAHASTQIAAITEEDAAGSPVSYDTVVTCRLEGVNIFNQFTADEIVGHLSTKTSKDGMRTAFQTVGTRFVNMRIGGVLVEPTMRHEGSDDCGNTFVQPEPLKTLNAEKKDWTDQKQAPKEGRGFLTSLVSDAKVNSKPLLAKGNAIYVPDFGIVYLAEYLVAPHARHLNMFRIQLGCGFDGRASGGGMGANGQTCPPPPV